MVNIHTRFACDSAARRRHFCGHGEQAGDMPPSAARCSRRRRGPVLVPGVRRDENHHRHLCGCALRRRLPPTPPYLPAWAGKTSLAGPRAAASLRCVAAAPDAAVALR